MKENMKIQVDMNHLTDVLQAILGPGHQLRALMVIASLDPILRRPDMHDPLGRLIDEVNAHALRLEGCAYAWIVTRVFDLGIMVNHGAVLKMEDEVKPHEEIPLFTYRGQAIKWAQHYADTLPGDSVERMDCVLAVSRVNLRDLDFKEDEETGRVHVIGNVLDAKHFERDDVFMVTPCTIEELEKRKAETAPGLVKLRRVK